MNPASGEQSRRRVAPLYWRSALTAYAAFVAGSIVVCVVAVGLLGSGHSSGLADAFRGMQYLIAYAAGSAAIAGSFPLFVCVRRERTFPLAWAAAGIVLGVPLMFAGLWAWMLVYDAFHPATKL